MIYAVLIAFAVLVGTLGINAHNPTRDNPTTEQHYDLFLKKGASGIDGLEEKGRTTRDASKEPEVSGMPQYMDLYLQPRSRKGDEEK